MNLEDKKKEVLERGKAERGEYTPDPNSVPARMYRYWYKHTEFPPARENFCHYWRVVVFWAPLWWVFNHTAVLVLNPVVDWVDRGGGDRLAHILSAPARGYRKIGTKAGRKKFWEYVGWGIVGLFALFCIASLVMAFIKTPLAALIWVGILVGTVAVLIGAAMGLSRLGAIFEKKRRAQYEALVDDYLEGKTDVPPWVAMHEKKPSRVKRFFRGVGDFLVLLAQIVRVKKWKICPLVEIPTEGLDTSSATV
jgi:hypothetical protein